MSQHVLIVDDEQSLCDLLSDGLRPHGYECTAVLNVPDAKQQLEKTEFALVVLDIMMPGESGFVLLRWLRKEKHDSTPVILLTGVSAEEDKLMAFELGADDYVVKPFSLPEFAARVKAVLRRAGQEQPDEITFGNCRIDLAARQVYHNGEEVKLRLKEYQILVALAEQPGVAISRQELFTRIWGDDSPSGEKTVDVTIHTLREKVEDTPSNPQWVQTVRGYGYRFQIAGQSEGEDG